MLHQMSRVVNIISIMNTKESERLSSKVKWKSQASGTIAQLPIVVNRQQQSILYLEPGGKLDGGCDMASSVLKDLGSWIKQRFHSSPGSHLPAARLSIVCPARQLHAHFLSCMLPYFLAYRSFFHYRFSPHPI